MRLFVSLPIPGPSCTHLGAALAGLSASKHPALQGVRWTRPENLHLTLKFLGEVDEADLPRITAALKAVPTPGPLTMRAQRIAVEPRTGRAHLLTSDISGDSAKIRQLQESVAAAMEQLCFGQDSRAFWPHVTLGRSQKGILFPNAVPADTGVTEVAGVEWPAPEGTMDRFELVRSTPSSGGPRYEAVASCGL